ncbi:MAG TPA: hypothetical protein GXZ95_01720 [Mollicutes bacterium]|nr:hypothetical protein [Mollicutes bacterium]
MKAKWKNIIKKVVIVFVSLLLLGLVLANIDYKRTTKGEPPLLAIYVGKNNYTNAGIYYGLGYKVIKCPESRDDGGKYINKYELYFLNNRDDCIYTYYDVTIPTE